MRVKNLRSAGLLAVGAIASVALLTSACGDLAKRLTSKVAAVNLLLDARDPLGLTAPKSAVISNLVAIEGPISQPTASPIAGASVTMEVGTGGGSTVTLNETNAGSYSAISGSAGAATFVYASNQTYALTMNIPSGEFSGTYTTKIKAPPRTEVSGLPDTINGQRITAAAPLTLTLTSGSYDYGMVVVVNSAGAVTYSNKPETPQEFVNFILNDFNGTITIPGTAFPDAGGHSYVITVAGLASAPASGISPNLEILSHFLAGSAKTAIVITN